MERIREVKEPKTHLEAIREIVRALPIFSGWQYGGTVINVDNASRNLVGIPKDD